MLLATENFNGLEVEVSEELKLTPSPRRTRKQQFAVAAAEKVVAFFREGRLQNIIITPLPPSDNK